MISWFKNLFKKENNEDENYSFEDFSKDIELIKSDKNFKTKGYLLFFLGMINIISLSALVSSFSLLLSQNRNEMLFLFLSSIFILLLLTIMKKKIIGKLNEIKNFIIYKELKKQIAFVDSNICFLERIFNSFNNCKNILKFNDSEKLKAIILLEKEGVDIDILNLIKKDFFDDIIKLLIENNEFKELLKNKDNKKDIYEVFSNDILKESDFLNKDLIVVLNDVFGDLKNYNKDKVYYNNNILDELSNKVLVF